MGIQYQLDYLRRMEALYKQRPDLKSINPFGYQCLQDVSAIISVFRFGNLDIAEQLTGKLSWKTKKAIHAFRIKDMPESKCAQKEIFP